MALQQNSTEEAMNRVLEAERTAHAAVRECEAQAGALLEAAQQQVRRIHARTDGRIGQLHTRCSLVLGHQVELLLQQEIISTNSDTLDSEMQEVLAAAVARLAEALTGDSGNGG